MPKGKGAEWKAEKLAPIMDMKRAVMLQRRKRLAPYLFRWRAVTQRAVMLQSRRS
jgi:hypothetical protein